MHENERYVVKWETEAPRRINITKTGFLDSLRYEFGMI